MKTLGKIIGYTFLFCVLGLVGWAAFWIIAGYLSGNAKV